jgi:hypothetical protein
MIVGVRQQGAEEYSDQTRWEVTGFWGGGGTTSELQCTFHQTNQEFSMHVKQGRRIQKFS